MNITALGKFGGVFAADYILAEKLHFSSVNSSWRGFKAGQKVLGPSQLREPLPDSWAFTPLLQRVREHAFYFLQGRLVIMID